MHDPIREVPRPPHHGRSRHPGAPLLPRGAALALVAAGSLLAGSLIAAGCGGKPPQGPPAWPPARVTTAPAVARDVPVYLDEIGRCVSPEVVEVKAQVSGPIAEVLFQDGQEVKQGQPLFTIDPRPYKAKLDQMDATLAQNRAQLGLRRLEWKRIEELRGTNAVSAEDVDVRKSAVDVAEAQLKADEAMIAMAKVDLERTSISSPIDGRAGRRLVDAGNVVGAGDRVTMLVIRRMDPIHAELTVPESDLARVRESLAAGAVEVEVRVPDSDAPPREGTLTFVDNAVDEQTGTVRLRATLPNADRALWPGQFVRVRLILAVREGGVLVPLRSVGVGQQGPYVYVLKADSTVDLRPVVRAQEHGELVHLEKGVRAGEMVVTGGMTMLFPGAKVLASDDAETRK